MRDDHFISRIKNIRNDEVSFERMEELKYFIKIAGFYRYNVMKYSRGASILCEWILSVKKHMFGEY